MKTILLIAAVLVASVAFTGCSDPKPVAPRFVRGTSTNPFIWMDEATGQSCWSGTEAGDISSGHNLPLCSTGEVPEIPAPTSDQ